MCVARLDRSSSPGKGSASVELFADGSGEAARARSQKARERGVDVQVDEFAAVRVSSEHGGEIPGLALGARHRVRVKTPSGEAIASFEFSFEEYESDVVCVHDDAFYANWRIKRADRLDRCHCTEQARKLRKRNGALVL